MPVHMFDHDERYGRLERALAWANVAWLQIVGLQTHTVLHHLLHALPLALLAVLPRTRWIRHLAAMAGLMWVVMLSLLSPMIANTLREGIPFGMRGLAYTWLAPVMLLLAAAWSAVNLGLLGGRPSRWPMWMLAIVVAGAVLGWVQPVSARFFETPVTRARDRVAPAYAPVVALATVLALGIWFVVRAATAPPRLGVDRAVLAGHVEYWLLFLLCMLAGLLVD